MPFPSTRIPFPRPLFIPLFTSHPPHPNATSISHFYLLLSLLIFLFTYHQHLLYQSMADTYQVPRTRMQPQSQPMSHVVVKALTAVTAGGSLLVLSGLTLAGTVICLTIATPLLVIFSPLLVPAAITVFLVLTGFLASGGFGVAAVSVMSWIYRYVTGNHPPGADQLDTAREKLAGKAREMKERAEQYTAAS